MRRKPLAQQAAASTRHTGHGRGGVLNRSINFPARQNNVCPWQPAFSPRQDQLHCGHRGLEHAVGAPARRLVLVHHQERVQLGHRRPAGVRGAPDDEEARDTLERLERLRLHLAKLVHVRLDHDVAGRGKRRARRHSAVPAGTKLDARPHCGGVELKLSAAIWTRWLKSKTTIR